MIATVADLLEAFRQKEAQLLGEQSITHGPTIGSMYEGLTRSVLELALPQGLDLRVVSGFITNRRGQLSRQVDCMLVEGEGELVPYTTVYKYDIEKVIAIIEVKKNLYSTDLDSAYKNLTSVISLQELKTTGNRLYADAFRHILQSDPGDYTDVSQLPMWKQLVSFALYRESILPVRIVFGYHGFASEFGFREAFINYLNSNIQVSGYGPVHFPNLIIADGYSLIKLNGMPYGLPILKDREELFRAFSLEYDSSDVPPYTTNLWVMYGSYAANPMVLLLQLIWTRLVYQNKVPGEIFGLDLDVEIIKPLVLAIAVEINNDAGWHYEYFAIDKEALGLIPTSMGWQPVEINMDQAVILAYLGEQENEGVDRVDLTDTDLLTQLRHPERLTQELELLQKSNLLSLEDNKLRLLTRQCRIVFLPDGRAFAGDDGGARLSSWAILRTGLEGEVDKRVVGGDGGGVAGAGFDVTGENGVVGEGDEGG